MADLPAVVKANFGVISIALGIAASIRPMKSILLGLRSKNWRRVKAVVTASSLDREGGTYYPNIIYKYSVNGREHLDGLFSFAKGDAANKAYCIELVQRHPAGKEITVYVDPESPAQSVMEPGVHWTAYRNVLLTVLLIGGMGFAWQWLEAN